MATDMIARAMAAEAGSTEGVKNALTDTTAPEWTPAEQLAARQRLGMDKEWVLVGTIYGDENDRGNIDTGVNVDMSGCTELYVFAQGIVQENTTLRGDASYLITNVFATTRKFTAARFQDTEFGFDCILAKYSGNMTATSMADNATGYCNYDNVKLADITKIYFTKEQVVTSCDIKIYAR